MKATGAVGDGTHAGDVDYTVSTNRFTTHGYRDHSARWPTPNWACASMVSKLTLLFNSVDIKANDAGGLSYDEWQNNPRQSPRGDQYNTRKSTRQTQAGLRYERQLSAQDDLSVMMYAGERETTHQSIPRAPQLKPAGRRDRPDPSLSGSIPAGPTAASCWCRSPHHRSRLRKHERAP
jgi:iron complex outermembrane receptor protein